MSDNLLKEITFLDHSDTYHVKSHYHKHIEVVYYISGEGEIIIDKKNFHFSDNCISITLPGIIHDEKSFLPTKLIYIGFTIPNGFDISILQNGVFKCPKDVHILNVLKEILHVNSNGDFFQNEIINGQIYTITQMLNCVIFKTHEHSRKMIEIKEYIDKNAKNKMNAESVAKYFSYDYDYLRKLFKQYFHVSISDYIVKTKLNAGLEMMKKTNKTIEDIAKDLSFSSTSHYIKLFKKEYGITPKQFLLNYDKNTKIIINKK